MSTMMLFLTEIRERLSLVTLEGEEYFTTMGALVEQGVVGGTIYDRLLARCAAHAEAEFIYTWKVRHYRQFGPEIERRVRTP